MIGDPGGDRERPRAVYRLALSGGLQRVVSESSDLTVHDVSLERGLLLSRDVERYEILANVSGVVRDLSGGARDTRILDDSSGFRKNPAHCLKRHR